MECLNLLEILKKVGECAYLKRKELNIFKYEKYY